MNPTLELVFWFVVYHIAFEVVVAIILCVNFYLIRVMRRMCFVPDTDMSMEVESDALAKILADSLTEEHEPEQETGNREDDLRLREVARLVFNLRFEDDSTHPQNIQTNDGNDRVSN